MDEYDKVRVRAGGAMSTIFLGVGLAILLFSMAGVQGLQAWLDARTPAVLTARHSEIDRTPTGSIIVPMKNTVSDPSLGMPR